MPDALSKINTRRTPQAERARDDQVPNSAGGYAFAVTPMARLHRFLTLGTEGGTYYVGRDELTKQTAAAVLKLCAEQPKAVVDQVVAVSVAGRAPRNQPALFTLAACGAVDDVEGRRYALAALPKVARTATHLFQFVSYAEQLRGHGPTLNRALRRWYTDKAPDRLAYQLVKYRQREGWTHRDVLRLAKPAGLEGELNELVRWAVGKEAHPANQLVADFTVAQATTDVKTWVELIKRGSGLSWEMLPDAALNERAVWEALLEQHVPQTALLRQLPRLTNLGLFSPGSSHTGLVVKQLTDVDALRQARVHPVNVLVAAKTYASGVSARGRGTWRPAAAIVDALDAAFYAAFNAVPTTGKRHLLALDVSGSMTWNNAGGLPLTAREASGALALVTLSAEPGSTVVGFTGGDGRWGSVVTWPSNRTSDPLTVLTLSPRQRLDDAVRYLEHLPYGGTDCALPAAWARERHHDFDAITIYTDNETWAGSEHPFQALKRYRDQVGHQVRQVVVGMTALPYTVADPTDPDSLDVAGFDSAVPNLIADFAAGEL